MPLRQFPETLNVSVFAMVTSCACFTREWVHRALMLPFQKWNPKEALEFYQSSRPTLEPLNQSLEE